LRLHQIGVLNVAGNREPTKPGTGQPAQAFLGRVSKLAEGRGKNAAPAQSNGG